VPLQQVWHPEPHTNQSTKFHHKSQQHFPVHLTLLQPSPPCPCPWSAHTPPQIASYRNMLPHLLSSFSKDPVSLLTSLSSRAASARVASSAWALSACVACNSSCCASRLLNLRCVQQYTNRGVVCVCVCVVGGGLLGACGEQHRQSRVHKHWGEKEWHRGLEVCRCVWRATLHAALPSYATCAEDLNNSVREGRG
jgi:hypothetical protein